MISFTATIRDLLYNRTLVTPALLSYSIAMSIFCQFTVIFLLVNLREEDNIIIIII